MKLRLDLLKQLTVEDIAEAAQASQHRYKSEPTFSKTGIGYLSPRSPEDSAREEAHSIELTQKLEARLRKTGQSEDKAS
jgi:hypothetical protein